MSYFKNKNNNIWPVIYFVICLLLISSLFLPGTQNFIKNVSSKISEFASVLSSEIVFGTNNLRLLNSKNDLVESPLLMNAAQMKADDMARKGYFSHIGPNGDKPWVWFDKVGYKYDYAGENLAVDFTESADVTDAWINSAKHKANLLNKNFTEIGVGVADGKYEGRQTTFVVQFFGRPFDSEIDKMIDKTISSTTKLSMLTNPTLAITTRLGLPNGEVLGEETDNAAQIYNSDWIGFSVVFLLCLLAFILIIFRIIAYIKPSRLSRGKR